METSRNISKRCVDVSKTAQADNARLEIEMLILGIKAAGRCVDDCREFVRKVDCGEARSVRSYNAMKDHLRTLDALMIVSNVVIQT